MSRFVILSYNVLSKYLLLFHRKKMVYYIFLLDVLLTYEQLRMLEPNMAILNIDTSTLIKLAVVSVKIH